MKHNQANQSAANAHSNASSDQPLSIDDEQSTQGDLLIDTSADQAITVISTGNGHRYGGMPATGQPGNRGAVDRSRRAAIQGEMVTHGKDSYALRVGNQAQFTLKGGFTAAAGHPLGDQLSPTKSVALLAAAAEAGIQCVAEISRHSLMGAEFRSRE